MKIVQVCPTYYPHIGGVEYAVKSIAERLVKLSHEVTVLAGEPDITQPREEVINGVRVVRWPTWCPGGAYHFPRERSDLEKLLKEFAKNVDIVHIHSVHAIFTVFSGLTIKNSVHDVKIVVTPHYHGGGHTSLRKLLWIYWRRKVTALLSSTNIVHAVCRREASLLNLHYPRIQRKIVIVPNGVEEDVLDYEWRGQNSDYIIYAGRIEKYKRLELAVEIAKKLGLKLLIVGRGLYERRLRKYAVKRYRGMVEFLEPQPRDKYLELLSRARYAINLSKHEAYSIFTAEALAMRVPVIVSKEIVENLEAESKPFDKELVLAVKAPIKTWNEIVQVYLSKLYRNSKVWHDKRVG